MPDIAEFAIWITVVAGGLTGLGLIGRRIWRGVRAAVRAVAETRRFVKGIWELVSYELNTNGGGSIKDNIHDIAVAQGRSQRDIANLKEELGELGTALERYIGRPNPRRTQK